MSTSKYPRLASLPRVQSSRQVTKMAELADRDLLLTDFHPTQGRYGPGYRLTVTDIETGDIHTVLTSGVVITSIIDQIDPDADLPLLVKFTKRERYWDIE